MAVVRDTYQGVDGHCEGFRTPKPRSSQRTAVITELSPRDPSVAVLGIKGAPFPSLINLNTSRDVVYQSFNTQQLSPAEASRLIKSYDCGIERDRKVVKVCNLEGGWQVAARCEKWQDCEVRGGVGYCG
uniref:Uncharacterized protein n=1 Tax=Coccidioides posadasii RMSCC 3488 TaxID=454284 RepID=A0A0J6INK5_COCPO|nr:hypothetical protein CPAG_09785 [Coccidioides posadasii RMSCC 3488]